MARVASKRRPAKQIHRDKPRPRKPEPQRAPQQSIVIRRGRERDWIVSPEEAIILKNAICKGATDTEFKFCLLTASRYKLDPFRKQIHFVPRYDREAESTDGEKGGKVWVPVVGIDGLLHIAARDHRDFGTFGEPEYGPMKEISGMANRNTKYAKPFKIKVPEWCRVFGWKKGIAQPTVVTLYWDEIYPDVAFAPTVRKMPRLMIAKCCVAQIARRSYPSTGGLLIDEEVMGKPEFDNFTPEGRLLSPAPAADPHLTHYEQREQEGLAKLTEPQRKIVEDRMKSAGSSKQEMIPCLFYTQRGDRFFITGADSILHQNRELLKPFWNREEAAIVATAEQLGKLISKLEQISVPIKALD